MQLSLIIIHQIFLPACDWSKCVTRLNIPQQKLGNIRAMFFGLACEQLSRQSNGRSNPEVVGSISTEAKRILSLPRVVS